MNDDKEYKELVSQAINEHPDDPIAQIQYLESIGTSEKFLLQRMVQLAQSEMVSATDLDISFSGRQLEWTLRGIMDAINHLQKNLPSGVYNYIYNHMDTFLKECIQRGHEARIWKREQQKVAQTDDKDTDSSIPTPGPLWYALWNFSQQRLDQNEMEVLDDAHQKLQDALQALMKVKMVLNEKGAQEVPGMVYDVAKDLGDLQKLGVNVLHRLCEMTVDPYPIAEKAKHLAAEVEAKKEKLHNQLDKNR